jgi:hypothetical protein
MPSTWMQWKGGPMSISPWMQFDTEPPWKFPLRTDSGLLNVSGLTVANFQLILHPTSGGQEIIGSGSFSDLLTSDPYFLDAAPSIVYHESLADVSAIGQYRAWIVIGYSDGEQETLSLGYIAIQSR